MAGLLDTETAIDDARLRVVEEGATLIQEMLDPDHGLQLSDTPRHVEALMVALLAQLKRGGLLDATGIQLGNFAFIGA